ncbi:MAG TPA: phosphatidylglycerophosphatase A [Candidatus Paceibacterota bacterium]|nr:phosphatidylglycerophosphatase A [Verrucomicrobiota bacterium]HOX04439.1 phosphatidylglycerophosphatase A [Verrucomicrobiota bacterium]HRZ47356.1 phosphatidylglycerophosphatase A [Candidatus Paceibacterota bacterium]HRZ93603.1 phosphatidylglycerophosphatase A [Candidatus Paceibacterota bacterium]
MTGSILWLAQGCGTGRIRFAPGTFGSLAGLVWLALLLATGRWALFAAGMAAGWGISVWACGRAEAILRQHDPGSVVLDELTAVPLCYLGWLIRESARCGGLPPPPVFFAFENALGIAIVFGLFRLLDIAKPWPIRPSQRLPAGWGITADDLLAALGVNVVLLPWLIGGFE